MDAAYKSGIIKKGQLDKTQRWDALYNIAYQKHELELAKLLTTMTCSQLVTIAKAIPWDAEAARVFRGQVIRKDFRGAKADELILYLLINGGTDGLRRAVEETQNEMEKKMRRLNRLSTVLNGRLS